MKRIFSSAAGIALLAGGPAFALGLDRSGQDIGVLFEAGNYAELSFGMIQPSLTGTDLLGNPTGNVGLDYNQVSLGLKMDVNDQLSFALILDQPFGADVRYEGSPAATLLGGTAAELNSNTMTAIARYRFNENFSVYAGVRQQRLDADVTLSGLAYGPLNGYNVDLTNGEGTGWLAGVAYERPDIALRVALTYNSAIDNEFDTAEYMGATQVAAGTTTVTAPEAWNLDFQTGIAANTLLMASIRHASYSQTILSPDFFNGATGGGSITNIEDGTTYSIGIGRRFNDAFAGSVTIGYEPESGDDLKSPLSPSNGSYSLAIGGSYTVDNVVISGGVRYVVLGDAFAETADAARAEFTDNSAMAIGFSIGYHF